jgi:hypothetical protein
MFVLGRSNGLPFSFNVRIEAHMIRTDEEHYAPWDSREQVRTRRVADEQAAFLHSRCLFSAELASWIGDERILGVDLFRSVIKEEDTTVCINARTMDRRFRWGGIFENTKCVPQKKPFLD